MSELNHQYRDAPRLRSPAAVDQRVLEYAEHRAAAQKTHSLWWTLAPAVTVTCVAIVGVTLLLKTGIPPLNLRSHQQPSLTTHTEVDEAALVSQDANAGRVAEMSSPAVMEQTPAEAKLAESAGISAGTDDMAQTQQRLAGNNTSSLNVVNRVTTRSKETRPESSLSPLADTETLASTALSAGVTESFAVKTEESPADSDRQVLGYSGRDWLLEQPSSSFTLLLETITPEDWRESDDNKRPSALAQLVAGDHKSWVLVVGSFRSPEAARAAIEEWGLTSRQPRVVSFGDLPAQLGR